MLLLIVQDERNDEYEYERKMRNILVRGVNWIGDFAMTTLASALKP
jgi:hypothetical protein